MSFISFYCTKLNSFMHTVPILGKASRPRKLPWQKQHVWDSNSTEKKMFSWFLWSVQSSKLQWFIQCLGIKYDLLNCLRGSSQSREAGNNTRMFSLFLYEDSLSLLIVPLTFHPLSLSLPIHDVSIPFLLLSLPFSYEFIFVWSEYELKLTWVTDVGLLEKVGFLAFHHWLVWWNVRIESSRVR